jgi:hypothetical protein
MRFTRAILARGLSSLTRQLFSDDPSSLSLSLLPTLALVNETGLEVAPEPSFGIAFAK